LRRVGLPGNAWPQHTTESAGSLPEAKGASTDASAPRISIDYEDATGVVTHREISELMYRSLFTFDAYCHLRNEIRTFYFKQVTRAVDVSTGEVVADLRPLVGIPPLPKPPPRPPSLIPREQRRRLGISSAELRALRTSQRANFIRGYGIRPVYEHFRSKLVAAFGGGCFRCGARAPLVLDHCVPIALGGRLVPGNITVLCRECNELKGEAHPEDFYAADEMSRLVLLLEAQIELLAFEWKAVRWWSGSEDERRQYLREIGLGTKAIEGLFDERGLLRDQGGST
jgi:hypothetical protein